jgi:hypothetical protein
VRAAGLLAALAAVAALATPAGAHGGNADGSRPFVTGVEPALPGVAATAVFAGSWEASLAVVSDQDVSILDDAGRPFVRIGRNGVEGDYASSAWYASAVAPNGLGTVRLPDGVSGNGPPDWRPVARVRAWAWFDPRLRATPGAITPDMVQKGAPARLSDFSIPIRVGDQAAKITGYLEFEPPRGRYVHRLTSNLQPAPGVEIGLLGGQAVPTITIRDESPDPVTVLGSDGEPFLRVDADVEANLASPTWVQVGRALGRTPKALADASAPPHWEQISPGHLLSWADFRSRPPDSEPQFRTGQPIEVKRWAIPIRIGDKAVEINGVTAFEPFSAPTPAKSGNVLPVAPIAGGAVVLLIGAALAWRSRAGDD